MSTVQPTEKVISLSSRRPGAEAFITPSRKRVRPSTRAVSITSGKGGVGKTNIVANIGYELSRSGQKVLILDADLGLGNLDILLGLAPRYNLSHVIMGEKRIEEIVVDPALEGSEDRDTLRTGSAAGFGGYPADRFRRRNLGQRP